MPNYFQYREEMAKRESNGLWKAKNKFGYLGRYQFGLAALCDLGLTKQTDTGYEWVPPFSEEMFLNSPELQNLCFRAHTVRLQEQVKQFESALVAACHLGGLGNLHRLLFEGVVFKDGNGTPLTEYIKTFKGYDL